MKTQTTPVEFNFPTYPKPTMNAYQKAAEARALECTAEVSNEKARREYLLDKANNYKVSIVHIFDKSYAKGGLTIAFAPTTDYANCTMVEVAVNTCSKKDTFSRTKGTVGALEKFFSQQTIQLPLLQNYPRENLNLAVKLVFSHLYNSIY